jgi:hypothetical protein
MILNKVSRAFGFFLLLQVVNSCAPTRFYKPLQRGEQAITATFGGPLIRVPNVAPMPIPFTSIGYGRGLTKNITAYGSWQTTSAVFGVVHFDFGATHRIWNNDKMGVSGSVGGNFLIDVFEWNPSLYPQLSANYYYTYRQNTEKNRNLEFYVGTENWLDLRSKLAHDVPNPNRFLWNMHLGHTFKNNSWSYQLEVKMLAPYINNDVVVDYISPFGNRGGLGFYFGVQRIIGKK